MAKNSPTQISILKCFSELVVLYAYALRSHELWTLIKSVVILIINITTGNSVHDYLRKLFEKII